MSLHLAIKDMCSNSAPETTMTGSCQDSSNPEDVRAERHTPHPLTPSDDSFGKNLQVYYAFIK